jgi:hypothetical protein
MSDWAFSCDLASSSRSLAVSAACLNRPASSASAATRAFASDSAAFTCRGAQTEQRGVRGLSQARGSCGGAYARLCGAAAGGPEAVLLGRQGASARAHTLAHTPDRDALGSDASHAPAAQAGPPHHSTRPSAASCCCPCRHGARRPRRATAAERMPQRIGWTLGREPAREAHPAAASRLYVVPNTFLPR